MMIRTYPFHSPTVFHDFPFLSIGKHNPHIDITACAKGFEEQYATAESHINTVLKNRDQHSFLIMSGTFIDHLRTKNPKQITAIKKALDTGHISLLGTPYHHSIASLFSTDLFIKQVGLHLKIVKDVFDYTPTIFYNTNSIYSDRLARVYKKLGFKVALVPSSEWHLGGRTTTQPFYAKDNNIQLLIHDDQGQCVEGSDSVEDFHKAAASESYLVPYPIYHNEHLLSKITNGNKLVESLKLKILSLEKAASEIQNSSLFTELSSFTALEHFEKIADVNDLSSYDYYINMMNILSDFELRYKL